VDVTQVKATIGQGGKAAEKCASAMVGVRDHISQAQALAAETTRGSSHEELTAGIEKLKQAHTESTKIIELLRSGAASADRYAAKIG
jgi:hypothetical protein